MPLYNFFEKLSFSLTVVDLVKESAQVFFSNTGMSYFMYVRGTIDGSLSILFSDGRFPLDWLGKSFELGIGYSAEYKGLQTFSYFWEERLPAELISLAQDKYHLRNGISIVKRYRNYFEMFGFADSCNHTRKSTYLTCLNDLNNFADYFVKSNKHLIDQASRHPVFSPSPLSLQRHREICLADNGQHFQATGLLGDVTLTSQEFFSLRLYVDGKPYKEIGKILSISDKMVEKYLRNIKAKLGYHPRDIAFLQEDGGRWKFGLFEKNING